MYSKYGSVSLGKKKLSTNPYFYRVAMLLGYLFVIDIADCLKRLWVSEPK